jgi:hypothetical protein
VYYISLQNSVKFCQYWGWNQNRKNKNIYSFINADWEKLLCFVTIWNKLFVLYIYICMSKTFIFLVSSHKNISKYQAENSSYLTKMLKQHCYTTIWFILAVTRNKRRRCHITHRSMSMKWKEYGTGQCHLLKYLCNRLKCEAGMPHYLHECTKTWS